MNKKITRITYSENKLQKYQKCNCVKFPVNQHPVVFKLFGCKRSSGSTARNKISYKIIYDSSITKETVTSPMAVWPEFEYFKAERYLDSHLQYFKTHHQ
jgi:hypothetical protein